MVTTVPAGTPLGFAYRATSLVQTVFPPWLHNIGKRCYLGIKYREKEREEGKERENNVIET